MNPFALLLTNLQAVIAAKAARERALTVMLVALWGRIARMGTRLERLVALWRAGKLPKPRAPRVRAAQESGPRTSPEIAFPTAPAWLRRKLGHEVGAFGSQLTHLLTTDECVAFLAACPQAGRILRPLLRMLTPDPLPAVVRTAEQVAPVAATVAQMVGIAVAPASQFLDA